MTNLNAASVEDIVAVGVDPDLARTLTFWRPYRAWDDLLGFTEVDDLTLHRLRGAGFEITPPNDADWAPPKAFDLSRSAV
jgi:DNA uptake protein ComE-like DNA-binding protein